LARAFRAGAKIMPRARLGDGSWQFEDDALAALRAKIKAGKKTLGEVYGPPLYGIKTGLNEAFIVNREQRDALVKRDTRSAELLIPFLRGENIKRWRVESEDLFLINTPKGKVRIDDYPAIRDHLLPFKPALEGRATKQEWYELQQPQLAYQPKFATPKISYGHFAQNTIFAFDRTGYFSNDKSYFIPNADYGLLGFLNSKLAWFFVIGLSPAVRGGFHELRVQYIEQIPLPQNLLSLELSASDATRCAIERAVTIRKILRRIPDLCPPGRKPKLTNRLREWWSLDFKEFQAEIKKAFKVGIPLKQRNEWETFLREEGDKVRQLTAEIGKAEREIDRLVYELFNLTPDEIALLESSLAGQ